MIKGKKVNRATMRKMMFVAIFAIILAACELFSPERSSWVALVAVISSVIIDRGLPICLYICVDVMNIELPDSIQVALLLFVGLIAILILLKDNNKSPLFQNLLQSLFFYGIIVVISFCVGVQCTIMYVIRSLYVFMIAFAIGFHFCGSRVKLLYFTFLSSGLAVMGIVMYQFYSGTMQLEFEVGTGRLTYGEQVRTLSNALAFPVYYSFVEYLKAIEKGEYVKKVYWIGIVLLGIALILLTVSRGVIFAVGITLVFILLARMKNVKNTTLIVTTLFVALIIYFVSTIQLNTEYMFNKIETFTGRDEIWDYYLGRVFHGSPLNFVFGYGPGDIKRLSVGTDFANAYEHSLFIGFFVSFGLIGFIYLLWVIYKIGKLLWDGNTKYDFGLFLLTMLLFVPFGTALKPLFYYLLGLCLALSISESLQQNRMSHEKQIKR